MKNNKLSSMAKDIFDQPKLIDKSINNRINFSNYSMIFPEFKNSSLDILSIDRIIFTGMGTSYNAALYGAHIMEKISKIPSKAQNASELYHNGYFYTKNTLLVVISQSGESSDVIQVMRNAKAKNIFQIVISESRFSEAAKISNIFLPIKSGIENSIAATKTFSLSILLLLHLSLYFAEKKSISISKYIQDIKDFPSLLSKYLKESKNINNIKRIAKYISKYDNIFCLGRGSLFTVALEGALKIKETTYIHAEGYNTEELRHGPFALLGKNIPVIICANDNSQKEKNRSIVNDVISCGSPVIALVTDKEKHISKLANEVIFLPELSEIVIHFFPLVVFQLLSYNASIALGNNPDELRNLSKIVKL
jgi:glucosamine--fructose-6-phosphate aminotransferase (isomerizing)